MDTRAKLEAVETKMRRWHSRLNRASTMLAKLERQRRRLTAKASVPAKPKAPDALATRTRDLIAEVADYDAIEKAAAELVDTTIPPELKRDADVDAMKAERRKAEEAERHKMPLTGKSAIDYIKVTPKTKKARK